MVFNEGNPIALFFSQLHLNYYYWNLISSTRLFCPFAHRLLKQLWFITYGKVDTWNLAFSSLDATPWFGPMGQTVQILSLAIVIAPLLSLDFGSGDVYRSGSRKVVETRPSGKARPARFRFMAILYFVNTMIILKIFGSVWIPLTQIS